MQETDQTVTMLVRFRAHPGQGEALARILLTAGEQGESDPDCLLYGISMEDNDPDTVWVTERWRSAEAQQASLKSEEAQALIGQAMPMIASAEPIRLRALGGKGWL